MTVKRHTVGDGDARVDGTVEHMIRLAHADKDHPKVVAIAKRIQKTSEHDYDYIQAVHDFIVDDIEYRLDEHEGESIEVVAAPRHTIGGNRKYGDCDCMVTAFATLMLIAGYDCKVKVVAWRPEAATEFTHVYIVCHIPSLDVWIPCDPTRGRDGFGWQVSPRYREHLYDV